MHKITEIIPDSIPDWAKDAMDDGQFFRMTLERIASLEAQLKEREWMPIESAPKDGSSFLAHEEGYGTHETYWDKDHDYSGGFRNMIHGWRPTRWMPLPKAPVTGSNDNG